MKIQKHSKSGPMILFAFLILGCGENFGRVNQGQVIAYDPHNGMVTLIQDSNYIEPGKPRFDVLPPLKVRVPLDPKEMGPTPEAGRLLDIDVHGRKVVFYDASSQALRTFDYVPIEQQAGVFSSDPRVSRAQLPIINRQNATATLYSRRHRLLVTLRIPQEYLALPDETWKVGDEVRYYYKDPGQALRMMNVTKTDLTGRG